MCSQHLKCVANGTKDWDKLEAVRQAIACEIEGERDFCFERQ